MVTCTLALAFLSAVSIAQVWGLNASTGTTTTGPTYLSVITSVPVIYVAGGVVDCGGALLPDVCSTQPNPDIEAVFPGVTTMLTWFAGYPTSLSQFSNTGDIPMIGFIIPTGTLLTLETGYSPSISPTDISQANQTSHLAARSATSEDDYHEPPPVPHGPRMQRRSYSYDSCANLPPDHDFVSNSLTEVCHFVANAQAYFVSLKPTPAGYLPGWGGYVVQVVVSAWNLFSMRSTSQTEGEVPRKGPGPFKILFGIAATVIGTVKTIFAIYTITQHTDSFDTLPFISPMLWLDWVGISGFFSLFARIPTILAGVIGACIYVMCFWLCVGYGHKGYGVRQYDVLNVPLFCQSLNIAWQTDPRRDHFLLLHMILFAIGSFGMITAIILFADSRGHLDISDVSIVVKFWPGRFYEGKVKSEELLKGLQAFIALCVIVPALAGVFMAAILNSHAFLILGQKQCYASFVSGRFSYLDEEWVEWSVKAATWLGLNT